jgi:hypothetical protein
LGGAFTKLFLKASDRVEQFSQFNIGEDGYHCARDLAERVKIERCV